MNKQQTHNTDYTDEQANKHITQTTQMNKQQTHNTDYTDEQATNT